MKSIHRISYIMVAILCTCCVIISSQVANADPSISQVRSDKAAKSQQHKASEEPLEGADSTIRLSQIESIKNADPALAGITTSSIHRVWTASSSGSLDELSPEMIGKLNQDVPFLAAYALRPRLVGSSNNNNKDPQKTSASSSIAQQEPKANQQQLLASSSRSQRILASPGATDQPGSFPHKLGDFTEFNVDVSSTSKSEHHHRRKTTLKKNKNKSQVSKKSKSPRTIDGLLRELKMTSSKRKRMASLARGKSTRGRGSGRSRSGRGRSQNRRRSSSSRRRRQRARSGKLQRGRSSKQQQLQDDTGTKGGSRSSEKPFFAGREDGNVGVAAGDKNSLDEEQQVKGGSSGKSDAGSDEAEVGDEGGSEAEEPELKRAGEGDVEEGGDTVEVEPKYDGVPDDPELPEENPDENPGGEMNKVGGKAEGESVATGGGSARDDQDDATMTKRDEDSSPGGSMAIGGGIGATTGGEGSSVDAGSPPDNSLGDEQGGEHEADDDDDRPRMTPASGNGNSGSSVEFANGSDSGTPTKDSGSNSQADDFGNRRRVPGGSNFSGSSNGGAGDSSSAPGVARDDDVDSGDARDSKGRKQATNDYDYDDDEHDDDNSDDDLKRKINDTDNAIDNNNNNNNDNNNNDNRDRNDGVAKSAPKECHEQHDDGHYDHSLDHEHDHHHHGSHHDKIDWLRKSIPGEPGKDYPILSRINATNFHCSEQKWPGYYADVDLDCQGFHICQADGRQDSFLCPNGTIFSQIVRVCVWWNSFQCEDAPKYYQLNANLYKQMTNLRPPTMPMMHGARRGFGGGDASEDSSGAPDHEDSADGDSAVDTLVKSMPRAGQMGSAGPGRPDDVIQDRDEQQRKETSREQEDDKELEPDFGLASERERGGAIGKSDAARLRRPNSVNAIDRPRRRRASSRALLKSRRLSRKRKLRQIAGGTSKPKRRA